MCRGGRLCRRLGLGGGCWGGDGFQGRLGWLSSLHRGVPGGELCQLYQRQFHQQALVAAEAVVQIAVVTQLNGLIQERQGALPGLLAVALPNAGSYFKQGQGGGICADQQVAKMGSQSGDEMVAVEALVQYLVEQQQGIAHFVVQQDVCQAEIVLVIQHVEVFYHLLIGDVSSCEAGCLVEDG